MCQYHLSKQWAGHLTLTYRPKSLQTLWLFTLATITYQLWRCPQEPWPLWCLEASAHRQSSQAAPEAGGLDSQTWADTILLTEPRESGQERLSKPPLGLLPMLGVCSKNADVAAAIEKSRGTSIIQFFLVCVKKSWVCRANEGVLGREGVLFLSCWYYHIVPQCHGHALVSWEGRVEAVQLQERKR